MEENTLGTSFEAHPSDLYLLLNLINNSFISKIQREIITRTYRFYIFDIDLRQISCLIFAV